MDCAGDRDWMYVLCLWLGWFGGFLRWMSHVGNKRQRGELCPGLSSLRWELDVLHFLMLMIWVDLIACVVGFKQMLVQMQHWCPEISNVFFISLKLLAFV